MIFQVALSPFCELFVSVPILTEYEEVLSRKRFKFQPDEIKAVMHLIMSKAVIVMPTNTVTAAHDPDDNMFLECAEEAQANYLVMGNKRHFPAKWQQTKVVSGREMMDLMLRGLLEL